MSPRFLSLIATISFSTSHLAAQGATYPIHEWTIADRVACNRCSIKMSDGPTVTSGQIPLTTSSVFAVGPGGQIAVGELADPFKIGILDSTGHVQRFLQLQRKYRPTTNGPPDVLSFSDDGTLHVVDEAYDRFPSGSSSSDVHLSPFGDSPIQVHGAVALSSDVLLLQGMLPTRAGGQAYHVLRGGKGRVKSFGDHSGQVIYLDGFASIRRRVTKQNTHRFLSVAPNELVVTAWDTTGVAQTRWRVSSSWFQSWNPRMPLPSIRSEPWPTIVQGVAVDLLGFLWILSWAPRADAAFPGASDEGPLLRSELENAVETVIEVFDLQCRRKVAQARFGRAMSGFVGGTTTVLSDFDEGANAPRFRIVQLVADLQPYLSIRGSCGAAR